MSSNHFNYFSYLSQRSLFGKLYRRFYLYPLISLFFHGKVLDVGCGIGDFIYFRPNTIGADINSFNIEYCKSRNLEAFLIEKNLPFSNYCFDGVLLDNVIEHISEPTSILNDIYSVLKPKGLLIVGIPGRFGFNSDPDHKIFYDKDSLVNLLESHGFYLKHSFSTPFLFRFNFLGNIFKRYCIYCVFQK